MSNILEQSVNETYQEITKEKFGIENHYLETDIPEDEYIKIKERKLPLSENYDFDSIYSQCNVLDDDDSCKWLMSIQSIDFLVDLFKRRKARGLTLSMLDNTSNYQKFMIRKTWPLFQIKYNINDLSTDILAYETDADKVYIDFKKEQKKEINVYKVDVSFNPEVCCGKEDYEEGVISRIIKHNNVTLLKNLYDKYKDEIKLILSEKLINFVLNNRELYFHCKESLIPYLKEHNENYYLIKLEDVYYDLLSNNIYCCTYDKCVYDEKFIKLLDNEEWVSSTDKHILYKLVLQTDNLCKMKELYKQSDMIFSLSNAVNFEALKCLKYRDSNRCINDIDSEAVWYTFKGKIEFLEYIIERFNGLNLDITFEKNTIKNKKDFQKVLSLLKEEKHIISLYRGINYDLMLGTDIHKYLFKIMKTNNNVYGWYKPVSCCSDNLSMYKDHVKYFNNHLYLFNNEEEKPDLICTSLYSDPSKKEHVVRLFNRKDNILSMCEENFKELLDNDKIPLDVEYIQKIPVKFYPLIDTSTKV